MKKTMLLLAAMLASALICVSCASRPAYSGFRVKRGTNLSHWLSQSGMRGEYRANKITEQDIINLKGYGFDHVRIPVDEEQLWDGQGNKHDEAWTLLTRCLDNCVKHDMRAIVDLHILRSHSFNAGNENRKNSLFTDEREQQKLVEMWSQLSDALRSYPVKYVAYEFLNEPVADDPGQWNQLIAKVHKALRALEPQRVLVIGSNMWQGYYTFKDLKVPEGDPNILLSCHFYEPLLLTHYTASWDPIGRYRGKLTYPGVLVSQEEFDRQPDDVKKTVERFTDNWDRERLRGMVKQAVDVAESYGLPLYCGEWGVIAASPREIAYPWMKDMISIFDEFDMGWSTWCYQDGFGFWNRRRNDFEDKPMLDILMSGKPLDESK